MGSAPPPSALDAAHAVSTLWPMIELRWAAATHVGVVRAVNQDAILTGPSIFAIADGMGGHAAGEVASALAIATLSTLEGTLTEGDVVAAVASANERVVAEAAVGSGREGMGTTLVGLALVSEGLEERLLIFNVGDSRAYRWSAGELRQVSEDHSLVGEMVRAGLLEEWDAASHPERHVITRVVGSPSPIEVDRWVHQPQVGERFLLCSDGLSNEVDDRTIAEALADSGELQAAVDRLLASALAAGARDNVSIVAVEVVNLAFEMAPMDEDTNPRIGRPDIGDAAHWFDAARSLITHVPCDADGVAAGQ